MHEGKIERRVQYTIEKLFAIRKTKFADHPGVIPDLDLIEEQDKITHDTSIEDQLETEESTNFFKYDPDYNNKEAEWNEIKKEILGEYGDALAQGAGKLKNPEDDSDESSSDMDVGNARGEVIEDFTEQDLVQLRKTIYLVIMNSVNFEECCHKLLKLSIRPGQEVELCNMVIECCTQDRTYLPFYGNIGQRFCMLFEIYQEKFSELFESQYESVHRLEQNKLRNLAYFFAHLMYTDSISWKCLGCITLTEEGTSASSRIFVKILFQEIANNLGLKNLVTKLCDKGAEEEGLQPYLKGIFPRDSI